MKLTVNRFQRNCSAVFLLSVIGWTVQIKLALMIFEWLR